MAQKTADFELGTNGNNILTSDPGSATAWSAVNLGVGPGTATYDTTHAMHGTLAGKLATTAAASAVSLQWTGSLGVDHYGRMNCYFTANPGVTLGVVLWNGACRLDMDGTGHLVMKDSSGVAKATFTNAIPLNSAFRIEWHVIENASGTFEVKLFSPVDGTSATETQTTSGFSIGNQTFVAFGNQISNIANYSFWFDDIIDGAAAYPGPAAGGPTPDSTQLLLRSGTPYYP